MAGIACVADAKRGGGRGEGVGGREREREKRERGEKGREHLL